MRSNAIRAVCLAGLLLTPLGLRAQTYSLDWSTSGIGGAASTGGVYTLSSTIGQSSPARVSSADYTIDSGFWAAFAGIQLPEMPRLFIRITQTNTLAVSWAFSWPGFALQENSNLDMTNWLPVAAPAMVVATSQTTVENQVILPMPSGNRFYRLTKL